MYFERNIQNVYVASRSSNNTKRVQLLSSSVIFVCLNFSICILAHAQFNLSPKMIIQFSLQNMGLHYNVICISVLEMWWLFGAVRCFVNPSPLGFINLFGNFLCSSFGTFLWLYLYRFHTIKINRKIPRGEWEKITTEKKKEENTRENVSTQVV